MTELEHVHGAACKLLEALALPHGTPVVEWHSWQHVTPEEPTPAASLYWTVLVPPVAVEVPNAGGSGWPGYEFTVTLGPPPDPHPDLDDSVRVVVWYRDPAGDLIGVYGDAVYKAPGVQALSGFLAWATAGADIVEIVGVQVVSVFRCGFPVGRVTTLRDAGQVTHLGGVSWPEAATFYYGEKIATDASTGQDEPTPSDAGDPFTDWVNVPDRTAALLEYRTGHGRANPLEATSPLWADVTLGRGRITGDLPTAGERFRLTLNPLVADALGVPPAERPRFTGEVTDTDVDPHGATTTVRVTGVGRSTRLGRVPLTASRPQETAGERVRRILFKANVALPLDIGALDAAAVDVLAQDYEGRSVAAALDQLREDTFGQLVEHRSGRLDWHDAEHRRGRASLVALSGSEHLIRPFRWSQTVATIVNDAEVTYGAGEGRVRVRDAASANPATGVGPYGAQLDTRLANRADAARLASMLVGRFARPSWSLPAVTVDVVRTAGAAAAAVLSLTHGDRIAAEGLPPDGPFTAGDLFVEGTLEDYRPMAWRVSLNVSDPRIAGAGLRWIDVDPTLQWEDVDPAIRWLDAALLGESGDIGTPSLEVDGGDAAAVHDITFDGGDAAAIHDTTLDGGAAA